MKEIVPPQPGPSMLLLSCLLLLLPSVSGASFDTAGWTWQRTLETADTVPGFVSLKITPELFDALQPDLRDLRVLDAEGRLTPHVIRWDRHTANPEDKRRPARLINRSYSPGEHSRVVADFGTALKKDHIDVRLDGGNYCRRVRVEGGHAPATVELIADNLWVIDLHLEREYKLERLPLPLNDFRYLRITVFNAHEDTERISIRDISAEEALEYVVPTVPAPLRALSIEVDDETGNTVIEADLGYQHMPLHAVHIQVDTPLFYRGVHVAGRNTLVETTQRKTESGWNETERETPFRPIMSGIIYRIREDALVREGSALDLGGAQYRYLRLTITNRDNPPLDIDSLRVERSGATLFFAVEPNGHYAIIGGNPDARAPEYDLAKATPKLDVQALPEARAGAVTLLDRRADRLPWSERHQWLVWVALLSAVAILGILIHINLKRFAPTEDGD